VALQSISSTLFCALIYRHLNFGSTFTSEFYGFLTSVAPLYDRMLLLGDFNIHLCCPGRPLVAEFSNILNSFGFSKHINQATHVLGHTLDRIMSYGSSVVDVFIDDASFSDHKPIVFKVPDVSSATVNKPVGFYSGFINSLTVSQFSEHYLANAVEESILHSAKTSYGPNDLISLFYTDCNNILDSIAPFKLKQPKIKSYYWLDDNARSLRQVCRKAERRWKHDRLTVSLEIFKECLVKFQSAAKSARSKYFSDLISAHCHRPKILFSTINSVINPISQYSRELSAGLCDNFLTFFVDKVSDIHLSFTSQLSDLSLNLPASPFLFCNFQHVSLMELSDLVNKLKTTNSSLDVVPPDIIKAAFPVIGPSVQVLVNSSLDTGVFPNA